MFGEQFKKLRNEQHISLSQAAENVTTVSTLSRWENGQIEMRFDQVLELLNNIHISPLEFISITSISAHTPFIEEVSKAYNLNNTHELKHLYTTWIKIYEKTLNIGDLFKAAIAANFYILLTDNLIMNKKYVKKIENIFSDVTYWDHYYISCFGNCLALLSSRNIYGLSLLIIHNLKNIQRSGYEYYIDTISALLNALDSLIVNDMDKAVKLSKKIDNIHLSKYSLYLDLRRKFLDSIILYKTSGNKQQLIKVLNCVKVLERDDIYDEFIITLKGLLSDIDI